MRKKYDSIRVVGILRLEILSAPDLSSHHKFIPLKNYGIEYGENKTTLSDLMFDYQKIDLSATTDQKKDAQLEQLLVERAAFPSDKNKDVVAIYDDWILDAQLEQCARTNNADWAQQLVVKTTAQHLTECLMQAGARGNLEVLRVFAQYTAECLNRGQALEAAAHYNHKDCVELMIPYCVNSADQWMVQKGVDAAIEGNNFELAHVLMPHIDITGMHSAAFRFAVRDGKQEVAELFYPYSNITDMFEYIKMDEDPETIEHIEQWINEYESRQLAQRINHELVEHTVTPQKTFKKI